MLPINKNGGRRFHLSTQQDDLAFEKCFKASYKNLCYFANLIVKNQAEAEDIVQDSFISYWQKQERFCNEFQVKSFLYKTVHFRCIDNLRGRSKEIDAQAIEQEESILQHIIRSETWQQVYLSLDNLPPVIGKVIRMIYTEGRTVKETAEFLGKSVKTIREQRRRGIELLRTHNNDLLIIFFLFCYTAIN